MIRSGIDLGRIKLGLVDEEDSQDKGIDDKAVFKDEEFFFNEKAEQAQDKEAVDEDAQLSEASRQPEDVVTVGDFIELLRTRADLDDKLMLRVAKKTAMLFDVNSRAGTTVVDIVPALDAKRLDEDEKTMLDVEDLTKEMQSKANAPIDLVIVNADGNPYYVTKVVPKKTSVILSTRAAGVNENVDVNEDIELHADHTLEDFMTAADLRKLGQSSYKNNSDAWLLDNIAGIVNGKVVDFSKVKYVRPEGYPSNGTFFLMDSSDASLAAYEKEKETMLSEKDSREVSEGRGWQRGGYGGTGRSYKSLGSKAPRGAEIGWYAVEQLDPKAKGKMSGWRCGPSNFPFKDLFFPNRKYKVGTMVMRNKYVNAGELSGEIYIAVPSYFEIVKTQNPEGLKVLEALKIPLDLTFGMDPNDDYTVTYTEG